MDSDKALCVRVEQGDNKAVQIISLASGSVVNRMPMAAESVILCPDGKTIAARAGGALQVYNLELQKKIKSAKMADDQVPVFWTWISPSAIGIVTATSVYHWSAEGDSQPVKLFERAANLAGTQVINYAVSPDQQWMMVVGIKAGAPGGPAEGCMQLYSVEKKVSQPLTAHAGCFATIKPAGRSDAALLFCFVKYGGAAPELTIIEIGRDRSAPGGVFRPAPAALPLPADGAADFPVAIQASKKHDMLYILTKAGYVYLFDIHSCSALARQRVSETPIFVSASHDVSGGVLAVAAKTGAVMLLTLSEQNLVNYVLNTLRKTDLAMALAGRLGLSGADELYIQEFNRLLSTGDVEGAIRTAANSPNGILRTAATIQRLQALPPLENGQPPALKYFALLMEGSKLNKAESLELARPALQQGKVQLIEKWLLEDKVTCSEALGDMVMALNPKLALSVYLRSGEAHEKVVQALLAAGEFAKVVPYALKSGYKPNFVFILQQLVAANPKAAEEMAKQLVKEPQGVSGAAAPPLLEIPAILDIFLQFQRLQEATAFLLDVLAADKAEEGFLQTKLLEMNLMGGAPQVAHAILGSGMFHHFDRPRIAALCEKAGLAQRALELYSDVKDIKRVMAHSNALTPEFLITYFGNLTPENVLECLGELLKNPANEPLVVKIATQYSDQLGPEELIKVFESAKMPNGLFYYLGSIVNSSENKAVHYKYIVAAANLKQFKEVERVCRDSTVYEPQAVRDFLLDAKLQDPRPLIYVCDRFGFVDELTSYLWNNKMSNFVTIYVQKVAPAKTPQVVGKLLDLDADEEFVKGLLDAVRVLCPVEPLVEEVEKRNRIRMLLPWLEARLKDGAVDPATHNALGKIYVTLNKDPQTWLKSNTYYDSKVVGKFCEKLDPFLAYLAYKRAAGACDDELIAVTNKNGLWKDQARYLVERQDLALWAKVLTDENPHRRDLIDQITSTALPETKSPDEVSTTVKAFMNAALPNELIGLLEKLVLAGSSEFANNRNLQNLLILTAVKCAHDPGAPEGRAMEYIQRLDNFDGREIAKIALRDEYALYEEAFTIYNKFNHHGEALAVLLEKKGDLERAAEYAQRVSDPACWSMLAKAQLDAGLVKESIDSYIRAVDATNFESVIRTAEREAKYSDLARYLEMARAQPPKGAGLKERHVDTALAAALAQNGQLSELETFLAGPNVADVQAAGDKMFEDGLFEAARVAYTAASNYPKLAAALLALGLYREAVEAAKKANSVRTWKEVNAACVRAGEFKLAQAAGLHIIVSPDHLEDILASYEGGGHVEHLMSLLEQGCALDNAHQGIFTELGVLYSRYRPDALMPHVKANISRINASKMLRACESARAWPEAVFIQVSSEDYDSAARTMMDHSPACFEHGRFLEVVPKVRNAELLYQALAFYVEEEPAHLAGLLTALTSKLDASRVVHQFKKSHAEAVPMLLPYLRSVQGQANSAVVNEAVNSILLDEEDIEGLRTSIDAHDNFDTIALAQRLEKHELLEMRRVAAALYRKKHRWEQAMALSKQDAQYHDAVATAAESKDSVSTVPTRGIALGIPLCSPFPHHIPPSLSLSLSLLPSHADTGREPARLLCAEGRQGGLHCLPVHVLLPPQGRLRDGDGVARSLDGLCHALHDPVHAGHIQQVRHHTNRPPLHGGQDRYTRAHRPPASPFPPLSLCVLVYCAESEPWRRSWRTRSQRMVLAMGGRARCPLVATASCTPRACWPSQTHPSTPSLCLVWVCQACQVWVVCRVCQAWVCQVCLAWELYPLCPWGCPLLCRRCPMEGTKHMYRSAA